MTLEQNNYENMWNELKKQIQRDLEHHISGKMQSMSESAWCSSKCKEILQIMENIENKKGESE